MGPITFYIQRLIIYYENVFSENVCMQHNTYNLIQSSGKP